MIKDGGGGISNFIVCLLTFSMQYVSLSIPKSVLTFKRELNTFDADGIHSPLQDNKVNKFYAPRRRHGGLYGSRTHGNN